MAREVIKLEGEKENLELHMQFCNDLILQAESQRETREKIWREHIMNYNSLTGRMWYRGRANIHVPLSFQIVETFVPRMKASIFPHEVPFDVEEAGPTPDQKADAIIAKSILGYQLNKKIKLKKKMGDIIRISEVIGTVIGKVFWREEKQIMTKRKLVKVPVKK